MSRGSWAPDVPFPSYFVVSGLVCLKQESDLCSLINPGFAPFSPHITSSAPSTPPPRPAPAPHQILAPESVLATATQVCDGRSLELLVHIPRTSGQRWTGSEVGLDT